MIDHLLESSHQDDSNKWSNIEFGEELTKVDLFGSLFGALTIVRLTTRSTVSGDVHFLRQAEGLWICHQASIRVTDDPECVPRLHELQFGRGQGVGVHRLRLGLPALLFVFTPAMK